MSVSVSVIIPNYNHARHLRQRTESILHQTYPDFEVILLDDCSTDNSREIIESYRSNPAVKHVVYSSSNSGSAFSQWKKGLSLASGDWVWFAESDDYCSPEFLSTMMASLHTVKGIGLIYCDSKIVDERGNVLEKDFKDIKNEKYNTNRWSSDHQNSGVKEIEDWFMPDGTINNASAVLFNRQILIEANPFDLQLKYIGDKYAYLKVMAKSNMYYVSKALNYYREPFNVKYSDKLQDLFREQFLIFNWLMKEGILPRKKLFSFFIYSTRISLFREWSLRKMKLFMNLFSINWKLLLVALFYNLVAPVSNFFKREAH